MHFEKDDFKDEDGNISPALIADYVDEMLEYTDYGYRFIYADPVGQVSFSPPCLDSS